jgi:signal peptidase I
MDHLRGRPFVVWWSFREGGDDDTNAATAHGPMDILRNLLDGVRHFLTWTRWERTGHLPR